jgi:peptide/nickel transport system substrate-binding protein
VEEAALEEMNGRSHVRARTWRGAVVLAAAALGAAACAAHSTAPVGPVRVLLVRPPGSLDPALAETPEALQADWLVYTPLLTYGHGEGIGGTHVGPGLAVDVPTVGDAGRSYTLTLRSGLRYSDGRPVKASDFAWAVERAIRLGWRGARRLLVDRIVGAAAFAAGKASSIAGIGADDATGQITIQLTRADGAFDDVLALPALAPVPTGTPMRDESAHPPPGVGPYLIRRVTGRSSFWLAPNPRWRRAAIPWIPSGEATVHVRLARSVRAAVRTVADGQADVLDWPGASPSTLRAQAGRRSRGELITRTAAATELVFFDLRRPPFSSRLVREAVATAVAAGQRSSASTIPSPTSARAWDGLEPGCYLIPPAVAGHSHAPCPYARGSLTAARALLERSGMEGTSVTVWGDNSRPARRPVDAYVALLDQIGLRATVRAVPATRQRPARPRPAARPQTGVTVVAPAVPNPAAFYAPLLPNSRLDLGGVDDRYLDRQVRALASVPADRASAVASFWQKLDGYVARQVYVAVLGYPRVSMLVSSRLDSRRLVFNPVIGLDWSSLRLK